MATIEVDEGEFQVGQKLRNTLARIVANPDAKKLIQRAHKMVDPTAITPDLDADESKTALTGEWEKKFNDLQGAIAADKAERERNETIGALNARLESGKKSLRDSGWTKEGVEAVEKVMLDKGISDIEIAAAWVEKTMPSPEIATPRGFGSWDFASPPKEDEKFIKGLFDSHGENDQLVLNEALATVRETRGQPRR